MKTALVTGSLGFIGRHMYRTLEESGWDVIGWDVGVDARKAFREDDTSFDLVVHCAALGVFRHSIDTNPLLLATNLELDAGMFQWAASTQPGRVIYFSSSAAYPTVLQQAATASASVSAKVGHRLHESNINLRHPQYPDGIYGWTKLTGEHLAALAREAGVAVSVVRPFNGYGEDQGTNFPFGALAQRAQRREDPFTVWGSGNQVRDFIHVDDLCGAIMTMVREDIDGPVNLGTGVGTSLMELVQMVCSAAGHKPDVIAPNGRHEGVWYRVADTTRLREFYSPKVSLEEGIQRIMAVTPA